MPMTDSFSDRCIRLFIQTVVNQIGKPDRKMLAWLRRRSRRKMTNKTHRQVDGVSEDIYEELSNLDLPSTCLSPIHSGRRDETHWLNVTPRSPSFLESGVRTPCRQDIYETPIPSFPSPKVTVTNQSGYQPPLPLNYTGISDDKYTELYDVPTILGSQLSGKRNVDQPEVHLKQASRVSEDGYMHYIPNAERSKKTCMFTCGTEFTCILNSSTDKLSSRNIYHQTNSTSFQKSRNRVETQRKVSRVSGCRQFNLSAGHVPNKPYTCHCKHSTNFSTKRKLSQNRLLTDLIQMNNDRQMVALF